MALPANLPPKFRTAARDFADTLRASFASGMPAQTEQDKKPILIRLDGILEKGAAALDDTTLAELHTLLLDFLRRAGTGSTTTGIVT